MRAGELRHRVLIQKEQKRRDADGNFEKSDWIDHVSVWAKVTPVSSRDLITSQAEMSEVTARMKIRYRTDIGTTMRVIWKNRIYAIDSQALDDDKTGNIYCTFNLSGGVEHFKD